MLSEEEIPHRELKNDFPGCGEQQRLERKENQRIVQTFSFLCLAVAAHICDCHFVGSVYRMERLVCGFYSSFWSFIGSVFCSGDCKSKPSETRRISVLSCAGISILTLAALFIFCKKDTLREFHKKLRM